MSAKRATRADARSNRTAIVEAALALMPSRGPEVSLDEIAAAAGVGRATIYRHFPDQGALMTAVFLRRIEDLEELATTLPPDASAFWRLFGAAADQQASNLAIVRAVLSPQGSDETAKEVRRRFERIFRRPLKRAQDAGLVASGISVADVRMSLLMFAGVVSREPTPAALRRGRRLMRRMLRP